MAWSALTAAVWLHTTMMDISGVLIGRTCLVLVEDMLFSARDAKGILGGLEAVLPRWVKQGNSRQDAKRRSHERDQTMPAAVPQRADFPDRDWVPKFLERRPAKTGGGLMHFICTARRLRLHWQKSPN